MGEDGVFWILYFFLAPPPLPGVFLGLVQCVSSYILREKILKSKKKIYLSTPSPFSPSFQGGPTIFRKGKFLKHNPHSRNL